MVHNVSASPHFDWLLDHITPHPMRAEAECSQGCAVEWILLTLEKLTCKFPAEHEPVITEQVWWVVISICRNYMVD